ncbi:degenerin mec-4 [Plakobranchus ocellatus]|uniref:Degenerin mec-4 n=1 Tax=Plakobranchus ocellatus TaxID=259542 RepID=A0AAV4DCL1_9GAST|nr:degenerin mec-4 [Plakobranchus ocellatus]
MFSPIEAVSTSLGHQEFYCLQQTAWHQPEAVIGLAIRAGPGNGLSMEFDVQFDEYLPSTTASGLKVLIHDNGEIHFPEDGGIMAGTGAATNIAIRKGVGGTVDNEPALRAVGTLNRWPEPRHQRPDLTESLKA